MTMFQEVQFGTARVSTPSESDDRAQLIVTDGWLEGGDVTLFATYVANAAKTDETLLAAGWRTVRVSWSDRYRPASDWADEDETTSVATVVPADADLKCPRCGREEWLVVLSDSRRIVCGCTLR